MAPEKHALLSASSAHRWLNCPPSAKLCAEAPDTTSPYAEEGTRAHALCEFLLREALGMPAEPPDFPYDEEMLDCAEQYRDYVLGRLESAGAPIDLVCIEQKVNYSKYAPDGYGTVDCLAIVANTLAVFDFKYGQGVEVDAHDNPQLLYYALGGLEMFGYLYDIEEVVLEIFQPRRNHNSWAGYNPEDVINWGIAHQATAELAAKGEGELNPGDWCRFCNVKAYCYALAQRNMELAALDFPHPDSLNDAEIAVILPKLDMLTDWASALKEYALERALAGHKFPGYKLVEGRSVRRFKSEADACVKIKQAGFDPYITKMKGLTELQKEMGKKQFEEVCGGELIKPAGKPALVPESDKRPELDISASADFAEN